MADNQFTRVSARSVPGFWQRSDSDDDTESHCSDKHDSKCRPNIHIHNHVPPVSGFGACAPWESSHPGESACEPAKCPPRHLHAPWNCNEAEIGYPIVVCGNIPVGYDELCKRNPVSVGRPRIALGTHIVGTATCNIFLDYIPKGYWIRCTLPPHMPTSASAQIGNYNLPVCVRDQSIIDFRLPFHVISAVCEFTIIYTSSQKRLTIHIHAIPPPS